jgi:erythromycin esterase
VDNPRGYVQGIALGGRSCEEDIVSVVAMIREARGANDDEAADEPLFRAKQKSLAVKRAERHFRAGLQGQVASWNARAEHFYLTTERLLDHFGEDSRGVVWAHNTHIGDGRATQMGQAGMVNIGHMAREGLGRENVLLVGFSTYRGETIAAREWEGRVERMTLPPAAPRSLDRLLSEVGLPAFFFFTRDVAGAPEFQRAMTHRAIGVAFQPEQERVANYPPSMPARRFDAIIFVEETTPVKPLHEDEDDDDAAEE